MSKRRTALLPLTAILVLLAASLACQTLLPPGSPAPSYTQPSGATASPPTTTTSTPTSTIHLDEIANLGSIGDPYAPELGNQGYDVERYTLSLRLDPQRAYYVQGEVTIQARSTLNDLAYVWLDLVGFEINELQVDGVAASFTRTPAKLVVALPQARPAAQDFTLNISYSGQVERQPSRFVPFASHIGLFYPGDGSLYALSEPDGARYWFPSNDHPRDKATFRFEISVPPGLTAVANGLLLEQRTLENGDELFIWEHASPMATYLATVAVDEFVRLESRSPEGVLLRHYVPPELATEFEAEAGDIGAALDWMSTLFGPYPFEAFGFVVVDAGGVALETQTMVVLSDQMISEDVLIHELAHMWFGDWVSLDSWGEMWRNEGFATYLETYWEFRDDPASLAAEMQDLEDYLSGFDDLEPLDNLSPSNLFGLESYIKGAVVVHALRQEVGEQAFFDGLRIYLQRYGGGTASDADFQAAMEEAANRSLDQHFAAWLSE